MDVSVIAGCVVRVPTYAKAVNFQVVRTIPSGPVVIGKRTDLRIVEGESTSPALWQFLTKISEDYVIYLMMTMLAFGGLVVTAQLNPMAASYHVDNIVVAFGMTAVVLAIMVDRLLNGLTRPFWGWVSDHIGRENAIFIAFILEAAAVYALLQLIRYPLWFVVLSGLCFFARGNIFSLFPSLTGDLYGSKWATTNYGVVYTAKGVAAAFAAPGAAWIFTKTGSWSKVFWAMIICDLVGAFMALLWLKPLSARAVRESESRAQVPSMTQPERLKTAI